MSSVSKVGQGAVLLLALAGTLGATAAEAARLDHYPAFRSREVAARQVDVWLPPGYARDSGRRYPVIYMHDGQNLFDPKTSYAGVSWSVDAAMLRLIAAHKTAGAIIVGIWNTPARFAEYMPQKAVHGPASTGVPAFPPVPEKELKGDAYLKFMVLELKPFIDRTYRTEPDRAHTFVMGSSMGGLISLYAVLEYPAVFGGAACLSTHWLAGDGAMVEYLAAHLPRPGTHRFYFDHGTRTLDAEYEPYQRRVDAIMRAAGYVEGKDWESRVYPGAEHSESSWRERVDVPLAFLLGGAEKTATRSRDCVKTRDVRRGETSGKACITSKGRIDISSSCCRGVWRTTWGQRRRCG